MNALYPVQEQTGLSLTYFYWYDPGDGPPPCGIDSLFDRKEDFAESVTAYVYPGEAQRRAEKMNYPYTDANRNYSYSNFMDTPRG